VSLCKRSLHEKDCDLKPKNGAHPVSACVSFCQVHDEPHEEIIERLDLIRMKKHTLPVNPEHCCIPVFATNVFFSNPTG